MALTKSQKEQVVADVGQLLAESRMTVVASYQGTPVKAMQELRRAGRENGTKLRVIKNRLVKQAIQNNKILKDADISALNGMLLYAFNAGDEVAPAQVMAEFARNQPSVRFVGAFSAEGRFLSSEEVEQLSALPGKNELIAQVVAVLASPLTDAAGALSGNLHGLLDAIGAKAA